MSIQPPVGGAPTGQPAAQQQQQPDTVRCPRCSAAVGPEQDWCLECGAPARTRLAQTPNWQLPTAALGAILLVAGALFAFAFVKLTDDGGGSASTAPTPATAPAPPAVTPPPVIAPAPTPPAVTPPAPAQTAPPASTTAPSTTAPPTTQTPGSTAPIPP